MPARALPSQAEMRQRLGWIDRLVDKASDGEGLTLSPQAAALFDEMRQSFASGCWIAALVLAQASLDAELQQGEIDGLVQNEIRFGPDYVWLRNRRNHLLHADDAQPSVTMVDLERDAVVLEADARRSIGLVVKAVA